MHLSAICTAGKTGWAGDLTPSDSFKLLKPKLCLNLQLVPSLINYNELTCTITKLGGSSHVLCEYIERLEKISISLGSPGSKVGNGIPLKRCLPISSQEEIKG